MSRLEFEPVERGSTCFKNIKNKIFLADDLEKLEFSLNVWFSDNPGKRLVDINYSFGNETPHAYKKFSCMVTYLDE